MPIDDDRSLKEILGIDPIAVVGCSTTPGKAAHDIPAYLQANGLEIVPVNPNAKTVLDRQSYPTVTSVEETIPVVNVFRPADEVPGIIDQVLARDDVRVLWLQLGITHDAALERAEAGGISTVQDRCMKIERQRLLVKAD